MAKIEIELAEIEQLKREIAFYAEKKHQLEEELKELSAPELRMRAVNLSYKLLDSYLALIFEKLGFDQEGVKTVRINDNLDHWLGKNWYNQKDRIHIEIGATVTSQFRTAFLSMGIIAKEEPREEFDELNP